MSVYRRKGSKTYSYDFRYHGNRFSGCTGEFERRKAEAVEKLVKERVRKAGIDRSKPLTFAAATTLYWNEVGQFHRNQADTRKTLGWLQTQVGMHTLVKDISTAKIADLVRIRRSEGVSNATVNRTVQEPMRAILKRCASVWEQSNLKPIDWKAHRLPEAQERVRELTEAEEEAYFKALREDYHPIIAFALHSGCRMQEILNLCWKDIDWRGKTLKVKGKGDKTRDVPISDAIHAILWPLPRAHAQVFTYVQKTARYGPRGSRAPITRNGLKITHARTCVKAGIGDFRFHDFRHTAATRLVRQTNNIKGAQKLLGHTDIATTSRYAHVSTDDLRNAMNATESATNACESVSKLLKSGRK